MSWDCPYQVKDYCKRLRIKCKPLCRGCVLQGKENLVIGIFTNGTKIKNEEHKIKDVDYDDKVICNKNVRD